MGVVARGRTAAMAWNANAAWTEAMRRDMRAHLAYMLVDMPADERAAVAAAPDTLLERYAVVGERSDVVARLAELVRQVQPELLLFDADDYSPAFLERAASVAMDAGVVAAQNQELGAGS
jgi:hypothetical protein